MKTSTRSGKARKKRITAQRSTRTKYLASVKPVLEIPDTGVSKFKTYEELCKEREPKGMPGGRCNVTACQRPSSAIFLNVGQIGAKHPDTGGCYYCVDCATNIHRANEYHSEKDGMTMFPTYTEMMQRYRKTFRAGGDEDNFTNYSDIDQNPRGSCHHFDRDKARMKFLADNV